MIHCASKARHGQSRALTGMIRRSGHLSKVHTQTPLFTTWSIAFAHSIRIWRAIRIEFSEMAIDCQLLGLPPLCLSSHLTERRAVNNSSQRRASLVSVVRLERDTRSRFHLLTDFTTGPGK